ncbi:MAG TPA: MDR family MFS transporter [Longimicrobiales bacterium]|nr:MDR family MFS transporter [Longimicrobiales bacterium]
MVTEHTAHDARRTHRTLVLTALVVAMFLAAIEGTIVATAMPSIASRLGGFSLYSWVFSSYLLMQAVTTPVFGKLADLYGRKPVFIGGVTIFLLGSLLCGFADSMGMLVAFRFVQGIGAGAVLPMSATLAGDLYSIRERGRIQGYLASVWGISSIIGPLAGGVIVENIDWHWIFWLNLPFGVISIALISLFLHESVQHRERSIDYTGTALLLVGLSALMLALTQAGEWGGAPTLALALIATLALIAFVRQQRSAPDPIMHFELWSNPIIRRGNLAILFAGVAMIGLITFLPTFVQGVLGGSALEAGFTLSGMSLGWPIASVFAGRTFLRFGVRTLTRAGGVFVTLGGLIVASLAGQGAVPAAIGAFFMGMGLGLLNTTYIVAIQTSVSWQQRGVATATNMLMRNLGNAVGAALLGGVLNARIAAYIDQRGLASVISLDSVRQLIERGDGAAVSIPAEALAVLRDGLSASLILVFWAVAAFAAVVLLISWRVPDLHPDRILEHEGTRG